MSLSLSSVEARRAKALADAVLARVLVMMGASDGEWERWRVGMVVHSGVGDTLGHGIGGGVDVGGTLGSGTGGVTIGS